MPRNGSGSMSIPNSFSSGTTASSSAVNANFTDIATEITGSLPRDGQAAMTGQLKAATGSASSPSITFSSDTDTGFFRKASGTIGIAVDGTEIAEISGKGSTLIPTGCLMDYGATTAPTGWVRANGRTIGNASSSATERANADTSDLFTFLWNNYSNSVCAVSSGRGVSAAADYAANKTIALPDLRGRARFGLDDMGNSAAGRLGGVVTTPTVNGTTGGTETVSLTALQNAAHAHDVSVSGTTGSTVAASTYFASNNANQGGVSSGGGLTVNSGGTTAGTTGSPHTHTFSYSGVTGTQGTGEAHSNMPPAFLATVIIKL